MTDLSFMDKPINRLDEQARYQETFRRGMVLNTRNIRQAAGSLARYSRLLHTLPPYETRAEADLKDAELALSEALLVVKLALGECRRMREISPITIQAAE